MAGKFDAHFFQKPFQLILQPHPVAPQLLFGTRHGAPQPLFLAGHETEDQLSGEASAFCEHRSPPRFFPEL